MTHTWVRIAICMGCALSLRAQEVVRPRPSRNVVKAQPGATLRPEAAAAQQAAAATPPQPGGFQALLDDGSRQPPDSNGAAGPNHVVTMLNSQVQIQDRSGNVLSQQRLDDFWAALGPFQTYAFDPRIEYDAAAKRWIASAVTDAGKPSCLLLIGASQTSDPTGPWYRYSFPINSGGTGNTWADYPVLGFNANWVAVTVNVFNIPATGGTNGDFLYAHVYLFDKNTLYAGSQPNPTVLQDRNGNWAPVTDYDNNSATPFYFVESAFATDGNGALQIGQVSAGAPSLQRQVIELQNTWAESAPNGVDFAPQFGTTSKIDAGDSRMQTCLLRHASIWCVQTIFLPAGLPTRSSVQWYQINPLTGAVQPGIIDDPTGNHFYAEPSLAVNQNGDVLIGYTRFSAAEYASAGYSFHAASDPPGTVEPDVVFKPGEAPYTRKTSTSTNVRWGDFSTTVVDPNDGITMWTLQEYASSPQSTWGTWWARVVPPAAGAAPCTYAISQASTQLTAAGGSGAVQVSAGAGCPWMATPNAYWITVTGTPGMGNGAWSYTVAGNVASGTRNASITVAGQTFTVTQSGTSAMLKPQVFTNGVGNAASYATGAVAPGELIAIFGANLGPPSPVTLQLTPKGFVSTNLDFTEVLFDGFPAPLILTSAGQVNAVVPFELASLGETSTSMRLDFLGLLSDPVTIPLTTTAPGIFTALASGTGQGAILNSDLSPNKAGNAAAAGSVVVLYLTGADLSKFQLKTGQVPQAASPSNLDLTVQIGGQNATLLYAGVAPGFVAGAVQINVVIPNGLSPGNQPVVVTTGGNSSQPGVTVAVR